MSKRKTKKEKSHEDEEEDDVERTDLDEDEDEDESGPGAGPKAVTADVGTADVEPMRMGAAGMDGALINEGDEATIPCRVVKIYPAGPGDKYVNVTLETLEVMYPQGKPIQLTVNAGMVSG